MTSSRFAYVVPMSREIKKRPKVLDVLWEEFAKPTVAGLILTCLAVMVGVQLGATYRMFLGL